MSFRITLNLLLLLSCMIVTIVFNTSFAAPGSPSHRAHRTEASFSGNYVNSAEIKFGGGSSLETQGDMGILFSIGYNFDEHLALDFDWGYNSISFTGIRVDDPPTTTETFGGRVDVSSTRFNLIYNFLPKRLTPYVAANIGWSWIDSNVPSGPPGAGCWWDPWWGYICQPYTPTKTETAVSYQAGAGVRWDITKVFSLQGSYQKLWIDASKTNPTFDGFRVDLVFRM